MSSSGRNDLSEARLAGGLTYIREARSIGDFAKVFVYSIGGIVLSIGAGIIAFGESTVNVLVTILDAFGVGGADWIQAFTSAPANFIATSFNVGSLSFQNSAFAQLGPFLPWIAVLVSLGVVWAVTTYLDRQNSDVPGLGIDIPFIGNDSDGEEDS